MWKFVRKAAGFLRNNCEFVDLSVFPRMLAESAGRSAMNWDVSKFVAHAFFINRKICLSCTLIFDILCRLFA